MVRYLFYTIGDLTYQSPLVYCCLETSLIFTRIKSEGQTYVRALHPHSDIADVLWRSASCCCKKWIPHKCYGRRRVYSSSRKLLNYIVINFLFAKMFCAGFYTSVYRTSGILTRKVMFHSFKSLHALRTWKDPQYITQYQYKSISWDLTGVILGGGAFGNERMSAIKY